MKIKHKINFGFLLVFTLISACIVLVMGIYTTGLVKKNTYAYLHSSNRARAEHTRTFLQMKKQEVSMLSIGVVFKDLLKEPPSSAQYPIIKNKLYTRVKKTMEADPSIYELFIIDNQAKIVASSNPVSEGKDETEDDYFFNAKKELFFKDMFNETEEESEIINYTISAPIKDDNGNFLGVMVFRFLPTDFYSIVSNENGLGNTEENFLVNKDKIFISPSRFLGDDVILKQKIDTQNVTDCFDPGEVEYVKKNGYSGLTEKIGNQVLESKDYRGIDVITTHAYIPETGWCLVTKVDKGDILSYRLLFLIILISVFVIAGSLFVLIGSIIAKKITYSINLLKLGIEKIKAGNLDYKLGVTSNDEIEDLSKDFEEMAQKIKESRADVDAKIKSQTEDLEKSKQDLQLKLEELENFNKIMIDRELKMMELKEELSKLKKS